MKNFKEHLKSLFRTVNNNSYYVMRNKINSVASRIEEMKDYISSLPMKGKVDKVLLENTEAKIERLNGVENAIDELQRELENLKNNVSETKNKIKSFLNGYNSNKPKIKNSYPEILASVEIIDL